MAPLLVLDLDLVLVLDALAGTWAVSRKIEHEHEDEDEIKGRVGTEGHTRKVASLWADVVSSLAAGGL